MIKDCTKIADNTILADMTVVPPFGHFAGSPGGSSALSLSLSLLSLLLDHPLAPTLTLLSLSLLLSPGRWIGDLSESTEDNAVARAKVFYAKFKPDV